MQSRSAPAAGPPYRVVIAEDEQLMRHALTIFLRGAEDFEIVELVENGVDAVAAAQRHRPDIMLMDIHMPQMSGIDATRQIMELLPETRVVALTTLGSVDAAVPMLQAGARGYLLKDCSPETLVSSLRQVMAGDPALSPSVSMSLLQAYEEGTHVDEPAPAAIEPSPDAPALTPTERRVLDLLAGGWGTAEIASEMGVAEATVKARVARLCAKFSVPNRVRLLISATEMGLVRPRLRPH